MRAADLALAGAQAVDKAYTWGKRAWRGLAPAREEPIPLTHRDVEHQQAQIRSATRRDAIPPPPRRGRD